MYYTDDEIRAMIIAERRAIKRQNKKEAIEEIIGGFALGIGFPLFWILSYAVFG